MLPAAGYLYVPEAGGISGGYDEDLEPSIGVDYDLGGLTLYAGYDADDEGGSIGATLSF